MGAVVVANKLVVRSEVDRGRAMKVAYIALRMVCAKLNDMKDIYQTAKSKSMRSTLSIVYLCQALSLGGIVVLSE